MAAKASDQALAAALKATGMDSFLTYSEADLPSSAAGLWVPFRSAVVVHATAANGPATWSPQVVAQALQQSLRGSLTASNLGIEFIQRGDLYAAHRTQAAGFRHQRPVPGVVRRCFAGDRDAGSARCCGACARDGADGVQPHGTTGSLCAPGAADRWNARCCRARCTRFLLGQYSVVVGRVRNPAG